MRKVFLCAVLALFVCGACAAGYVAAEASESQPAASSMIAGFGLHKVYTVDNPVILRVDGDPYYGNVSGFGVSDLHLAAKFNTNDIDYSAITLGTLTDLTSGLSYSLMQGMPDFDNSLVYYEIKNRDEYVNINDLAGHKLMWNLFTSPDVTVGTATIPDAGSASSVKLANDAVVPYVRLNHDRYSEAIINGADLYFVKSGDLSTPVALGDTTVKIWVHGEGSHTLAYQSFTNFNKASTQSFGLYAEESALKSIVVEYEKDGVTYVWNFEPLYAGEASKIDWGKLALDNQPLKVTAGDSERVEVKLPGRFDLEDAFGNGVDYFSSNPNAIGINPETVSFDQGSFGWNGLTPSGEKSTLSFNVDGIEPGRTVLAITIPYLGQYIREVHVLSADGSMHLEEDSDTHGITLGVKRYESLARHLNGKPYYPSAECSNIRVAMNTPDNIDLEWGYLGITNGTMTEIHSFGYDEFPNEILPTGVRYNSAENSEMPGYLTLKDKDLSSFNMWLECMFDTNFNVVSASLAAVVSGDYLTTEEQLNNFVPYFELDEDTETLTWSFINPSTDDTVTPAIEDLKINDNPASGTSGTTPLEYTWEIRFSYTYNGVNYVWNFERMYQEGIYGYFTNLHDITSGDERDVIVNLLNVSELEAVEVFVISEDILSVDKVSFTKSDFVTDDEGTHISFRLKALKAGETRLGLVFTRNSYTSADNYVYIDYYLSVYEGSSTPDDTPTIQYLWPTFHMSAQYAIVEGVPNYLSGHRDTLLNVTLYRNGAIPTSYYEANLAGRSVGTLYIYDSNGDVISSEDMYLTAYRAYSGYSNVNYERYGLDENAARIVWVSSCDIIASGNADVPAKVELNYQPYVKLNRDGINATTLEYGFMDNEGNLLKDDNLPEPNVSVSGYYSFFYNDDESKSGTLTLNVPEVDIDSIHFNFYDNHIAYTWNFDPVDKVISGGYVFTWDTASPDLPLVMKVGDNLNITLKADNIPSPAAFVGNSSIVSMDSVNSTANSVTVNLTAIAPGMTTITLASTVSIDAIAWPREIWVADQSGKVPNLTDNIDAFMKNLNADDSDNGTSGGWNDNPGGGDSGDDGKKKYENGVPVDVISGLSVKPRFVMPTDPTDAAYSAEWNTMHKNDNTSPLYRFEDNVVEVFDARDARTVFNELYADFVERHPAQIPALILPSFRTEEWGTYTFRIPTDSIKLPGSRMFMYAFPDDEAKASYSTDPGDMNIPEGVSISSEDISVLTENYSVTVSVDMDGDTVKWVIISEDIYLPEWLSYTVESTDAEGNISVLKISANAKFYDIYESQYERVIIPVINLADPEAENDLIEWDIRYEIDDVNMNYYTDNGVELEYISGDEYINVAVRLGGGTVYTPVIAVKATSNDIKLIKDAIASQGSGSGGGSGGGGDSGGGTTPVTPASPDVPAPQPGEDSGDVPAPEPQPSGEDSGDIPAPEPQPSGEDSGDIPAPTPQPSGEDSGDVPAPTPQPGEDSGDIPAPAPQPGGDDDPDNPSNNPGGNDNPGGDSGGGSGGSNSGGNTGGDSGETPMPTPTPNVEPKPVEPTAPTLNITNEEVVQKIVDAIRSISETLSNVIGNNAEVVTLPTESVGTERTELSEEEEAAIPEGEAPAAILPIIVVTRPAVYVFGVTLDNLEVGAAIFLHLMAERAGTNGSAFMASDTANDACVFLDDDGNEITRVPANKHVNIAAYLEPGMSYAPVITTTASSSGGTDTPGSNDTPGGNNTPGDNSGGSSETNTGTGSSGGGCNAAGSFAPLMLAVMLFTLRRKS